MATRIGKEAGGGGCPKGMRLRNDILYSLDVHFFTHSSNDSDQYCHYMVIISYDDGTWNYIL